MLIVKSALAKCCYALRNNNLRLYAVSKAVFECMRADMLQSLRQRKYDTFRRTGQSHDLQRSAIREYGSAVRITKACQRIRENKRFQGCAIAKRKFADGRYLGLGQVNRCHRRILKRLIVDLLQIGCLAEIDSCNLRMIFKACISCFKSVLTDTRHRRTVNFRRNGNEKGLIPIRGKPLFINTPNHTIVKKQLIYRDLHQSPRLKHSALGVRILHRSCTY